MTMIGFSVRRLPDPGTLAGQLADRKSELEIIGVDHHEGAYDAEAYDAEAYDVSYDYYVKRIVKA